MGKIILQVTCFLLVLGIWSLSSLAAAAEVTPVAEQSPTVVINLIVMVDGHDMSLDGLLISGGDSAVSLPGDAVICHWVDPAPWGPSLAHFARQWFRLVRQVTWMSAALM